MFTRAQNTYTTETLLHPKSGITSLVLVPLPHVEEPVDDIGPFLYGAMIGSAKLTNRNDQVTNRSFFYFYPSWVLNIIDRQVPRPDQPPL